MQRAINRSILTALSLAIVLAGCSSSAVIDQLPAGMGEPAGAPERPATAYVYPAVHDMPPPRPTPTMTDEQQLKLEKELSAARDKQEARDGAAKPAGQLTKKKPKTSNNGQAPGTQDGAKTNP